MVASSEGSPYSSSSGLPLGPTPPFSAPPHATRLGRSCYRHTGAVRDRDATGRGTGLPMGRDGTATQLGTGGRWARGAVASHRPRRCSGAPAIAEDLCRTIARAGRGQTRSFVEELVRTLQEQGLCTLADGVAGPVADSHRAELPGSVHGRDPRGLDPAGCECAGGGTGGRRARALSSVGLAWRPVGGGRRACPWPSIGLKPCGPCAPGASRAWPVLPASDMPWFQEVAYESLPAPERRNAACPGRCGARRGSAGERSGPGRTPWPHHYAESRDWTRAGGGTAA